MKMGEWRLSSPSHPTYEHTNTNYLVSIIEVVLSDL